MAVSGQDDVDLIRRHRYESVERVERHLDQQVDLLRPVSKYVHGLSLTELTTPAARMHFCRELNTVEWCDDVNPINGRPRDPYPIGHVKFRALGLDAGLSDVDGFLEGSTIERELNGGG
jgi:hypothetical protein